MVPSLRRGAQNLRRVGLVLEVCWWTAAFPVLLRCVKLRRLLELVTTTNSSATPERDDVRLVIRFTSRLARCWPAQGTCLVRSLVLYRVLRRMGLPVHIVFGVSPAETGMIGHAWLTPSEWQGLSLGQAGERFTVMYTFPEPAAV
jgi:hypothetical protein